jgi:hypothetical protein
LGRGDALLSHIVHLSVTPKPPATTVFGLLSDGEMVIEGPLLPYTLQFVAQTRQEDESAHARRVHDEAHILDDDDFEPASAYALALGHGHGHDGSVYFLILGAVDHVTHTMKRMGHGWLPTDVDWVQQLLQAPVTRVRII